MAFKLDFSKLSRPKTAEERLADEEHRRADERTRDAAKREERSTKMVTMTVAEISVRLATTGDRAISIWGADDKGRRVKAEFWVPECYEPGTAHRIENEIAIGQIFKMHGYWKPFDPPSGERRFIFQAQKIDGIELELPAFEKPDRSGSYRSIPQAAFSEFIDQETRLAVALGGIDAVSIAFGKDEDALGGLAPKLAGQVEAAIRYESGNILISENPDRLARVVALTQQAFQERPAYNGAGPLTTEYRLIWDKRGRLERALGAAHIAALGAREVSRAGFEVPQEELGSSNNNHLRQAAVEPLKIFVGRPDINDAIEAIRGEHPVRAPLGKVLVAFGAAIAQPKWVRDELRRPRQTEDIISGTEAMSNLVATFPTASRIEIRFDAAEIDRLRPTIVEEIVQTFDRAMADTARQVSAEAARTNATDRTR